MRNLKDYKNTPEYKLGKKKGSKQEKKKTSPYDMVGGVAGLLISALTGEKTSKFPFGK